MKKALLMVIGSSVIFILDKMPVRIMLLVIATLVSIYIFTRPNLEKVNE